MGRRRRDACRTRPHWEGREGSEEEYVTNMNLLELLDSHELISIPDEPMQMARLRGLRNRAKNELASKFRGRSGHIPPPLFPPPLEAIPGVIKR